MASVRDLAERVKRGREERAIDKAREEAYRKRQKEIDEAPDVAPQDFWCDHKKCKRDFSSLGRKRMNWGFNLDTGNAYIPEGPRMAWYWARCKEGHICERYILEKWNDPYFRLSIKIREMQAKHADDMLTPDDPRFKTVYPVQWARMQAELEEREQAKWAESKAIQI